MSDERDSVQGEAPRPLWAPWRIEYFKHIHGEGCFLCRAAAAAAPDDADGGLVLKRGRACLLVLNAYPYNSGHILVAPFRHVADLADMTPDELSEAMQLILQAKRTLTRILKPDGFNFGFNLGAAAGAGVRDHVHGHLVPRWVGDTNFMPVLGNVRVVPQALADTAALLRKGLADEELP
ncbi:MAG: AP-4-A phosphorylase [Lentisphaerae bacterium ADurb.BinA184]|nr:MAG: AP-4-A phosphorylase [Lentisphaerae bacterium ADurb.BinA184]